MMFNFPTAEEQDASNAADLQELAIRVKNNSVPENPVIFYGSSSLRLWDPTIRTDLESDSILNLAFGGSTVVTCGRYFDQIMEPFHSAKSMVIYAGDNDLGQGRSAEEIKDGFLRILDKVDQRFEQIPVFFVSIKPSPSKQSIFRTIVDSNRLIQQEASVRDNLHYVDIFTPMLTSAGRSNPEYFTEDMLHMNEAGYNVWTSVMLGRREEIGF